MTHPTVTSPRPSAVRAVQTGATPNATGAPAPNPNDARDTAIQDIGGPRSLVRSRPGWQQVSTRVARLYERGGTQAVERYLRATPSALRALATAPKEALQERMIDVAGSWDGRGALEEVQETVREIVREEVRTAATGRLDTVIGQITTVRDAVLSNLDRYRNAPADSSEGRIFASLGVDQNATPAEVADAFDHSLEGLRDLRSRFAGGAWEVGDFPDTARGVERRLGFRSHQAEPTIANDVINENSGQPEFAGLDVATILDGAHTGLGAYETVHAAHAFGAASAGAIAATTIAGVAIGLYIHHAADEVRQDAIQLGRAFGL